MVSLWFMVVMSCGSTGTTDSSDAMADTVADSPNAADTAAPTIPTCERDGDVLDLRPDIPDAPDGGIAIRPPHIEVPPFSQAFWCYWGTYTGPTTGVTVFQAIQSPGGYDHHNMLRAVPDQGEPDGYMDVCPDSNDMFHYGPLVQATGIEPKPGATNWLDMPDGVAMKLRQNQKWVLDMHYINPTACTLLVQNGINIGMVPAEEVENWAAPIRLDAGVIELEPQEVKTVEFDCEWPTDLNILSVGSHMHEHGTHYVVDHVKRDGSAEEIYRVDPWQPEYRDFPVMVNYSDGGMPVLSGEAFRTSCNYHNQTDEPVGFPDEMCTTFVAAYPMADPRTCMLGEWVDPENMPTGR